MKHIAVPALLIPLTSFVIAQDTIKDIESEGLARTGEGQQMQGQIDEVHKETRSLIDEYQSRLKLVAGLEHYNVMLNSQLLAQSQEILVLQESIGEVQVIERQILPLLARMIEGLDEFLVLDVPFLMTERRERTARLRELLVRSDVTVAEKSRRVLEAYQIENDYGRTIESYKDKLQLGEASFDADFLRVGRIGLLYRTVGNGEVGYWDRASKNWKPLANTPYRRYIDQGLKVANQEIAPELISIPFNPQEQVKR